MKSNLKEQVAEHQKDLNEQFKRIETLTDRIENYIVPRLQKMDKQLVDLKNNIGNTNIGATLDSDAKRISALEDWIEKSKNVNQVFFDEFNDYVRVLGPHYHAITPEEAMTLYVEMMGKFLKTAHKIIKPEIVVEELEDDSK